MFAGSVSKIAKIFDLQDDIKLAHEVKKYKCMYNNAYISICFLFLGKIFYSNQTYLCLDFSQFFLRVFDYVLKRVFLNFLLFAIHNFHFTNINNTHFSNHSHKKRKDNLETRGILLILSLQLEISVVAI